MSDLPELIHAYAQRAVEVGVRTERERIVNLVNNTKVINADQKYFLLKAIKGEKAESLA